MTAKNAHTTPAKAVQRTPRGTVLTIGDELLFGDIVDSNSAFLGRRCREMGVEVVRKLSVRDRVDEIVDALREASERSDIILISGGLGPTTDDLTAMSVAKAAGVELERHAPTVERLEAFFAARGREVLEANRKQADLPVGCSVLENPIGTAPGFALELGERSTLVACMPGVPREMKKMMREQIEPRIHDRFGLSPNPRRVYRTLGRGESAVQQMLGTFFEQMRARSPGLANVIVHYRAHMPEVLVTLEAAYGDDGSERATQDELIGLDEAMVGVLGQELYGVGNLPLVDRLIHALGQCGLTLATAESCTGGRIGALLTDVPGASLAYVGGAVSYANSAKAALLDVDRALLDTHGAVSEPVARAMAEGARARLGSDIAVSITGVAGPEGGTPEAPVGTLHLGVSFDLDGEVGTVHRRLNIPGSNRELIRAAGTFAALRMVWDLLVGRGLAHVRPADRISDLDD